VFCDFLAEWCEKWVGKQSKWATKSSDGTRRGSEMVACVVLVAVTECKRDIFGLSYL
jgi:hypothetical protein